MQTSAEGRESLAMRTGRGDVFYGWPLTKISTALGSGEMIAFGGHIVYPRSAARIKNNLPYFNQLW